MKSKNSNHPELTMQSPIKFSKLGTSQDPSPTAKGPSAVMSQSALQSLARTFNRSVPMSSGSKHVKSRGTKSDRKQSKKSSLNSTTLRMSPLQRFENDLIKPLSNPLVKFAGAAGRHGKPAPQKKVNANGESFEDLQSSITMFMLGHGKVRFYYKASVGAEEFINELECDNDVQRLLLKFAAYRCSWNLPDEQNSASATTVPLVTFGALRSPEDGAIDGFEVIFDLQEPVSPDLDTNGIMSKLGVPTGADIIRLSKTEAFDSIEAVFKIEGLSRSRFDEVLGSFDLPPTCIAMCASVYKDFGPISFPPITLNDFGNFCISLKRHGREAALATLMLIYSDASKK